MKRDPLFYRYFKELPECFFRIIGHPESEVSRYRMTSPEFKESSVRLDGVFVPRKSGDGPAYLWEAQYYASDKVYANLLSKIGRFLEHGDPTQDWVAVVIYPTREIEQKNLHPYRCLVKSDQLIRVYLEDLPPAPPGNLEMEVLDLIVAKSDAAFEKARDFLPRLRLANRPVRHRKMLAEFVETILLAHNPSLTREEVRNMILIHDLMDIRVVREAHEDAERNTAERIAFALLKRGHPVAEVAEVPGVQTDRLRVLKKKKTLPKRLVAKPRREDDEDE